MDNAGGHGTKDTIEWYEQEMLRRFNINIIYQIPRSPETNLLNLGIWCGLQHMVVEIVHRDKTKSTVQMLLLALSSILGTDMTHSKPSPTVTSGGRLQVVGQGLDLDHYRKWGQYTCFDKAQRDLIVPIVMAAPPRENGSESLFEVIDEEDQDDDDH
jgi:hypothetical protein